MEINYQKQINQDFGFSVAYNFSVIKNKMTELNGVDYIGLSSSELHGRNFDQETSRSAVGQPIGSFFVYEADGLFQSDAEIQNYKNDRGELLQPNAKPGDIRFKDLNGDGVINSDDRDFKGNPLPDCSMGLTLGFNYKNFDVSAFFQGVFGNEVYNLTNYLGEFYNQAQYNKILRSWMLGVRIIRIRIYLVSHWMIRIIIFVLLPIISIMPLLSVLKNIKRVGVYTTG